MGTETPSHEIEGDTILIVSESSIDPFSLNEMEENKGTVKMERKRDRDRISKIISNPIVISS